MNKMGGFADKADNSYYQMLDEKGISSALQNEKAAEISSKKQAVSILEGALLVRPSNAASPSDSLLFSALMLNMSTGILHQMTNDGPMADIGNASPVTEIRNGDTHHNFFYNSPLCIGVQYQCWVF